MCPREGCDRVGFLGARVIIGKEDLVMGMTSASVIWVLAGIGALSGFNHLQEAIVIALFSLFILVGIAPGQNIISPLIPHQQKL